MTAAQRNALAATWLQEGASSNLAASQLVATAHPDLLDTDRSVDSSSSSSSSSILQAEQKDVLETWMLMVRTHRFLQGTLIGSTACCTHIADRKFLGCPNVS